MRAKVDPRALGGRIRRHRLASGMSQEELAAPLYTAAYISHLENGRRSPSTDALAHIAERLGVSEDQLLTGRDPDVDLQLQLAAERAMARIHSGDLEAAEVELHQTRKRARREGLTRAEASAEEGLGLIAKRRSKWDVAIRHFHSAEQLLQDEAPEARTPALTQRAGVLFMTNKLHHAIHVLETHLLELDEKGPGDPTALLQTYSYLIGPYFEAGFKQRAAEVADRAYKLAPRVHDPEHLACMHINRAHVLLDQGHRHHAMNSLARAEDLFRQLGWRDSAAKAALALATAAIEAEDLDKGEERARVALDELQEIPNNLDKARALHLLARIAKLRREPDRALEHLTAAGNLLGKQKSLDQAWNLRETALCRLRLDQHDKAAKLLRNAMQMYEDAGAKDQVATTAAYLGDALTALGKKDEALEVYRAGLAGVEDLAV